MPTAHEHDPSLTQLISNLLGDVRTLIRQEVALAGLWILVGVTRAVAAVFKWPLAGVFAGIGIALGVIGVVLLAIVWRQAQTLKVLPKTRETLRERKQAVTGRAA